jgi:F1F0 ATPase subunit 2
MNEALSLALAWAAGGSLGAIFFGGLWWTVRKGVSSERPALWFVASVVLRSGIVLVGFYLVSSGDWRRLPACLIGFVMAQLVITRLTRSLEEKQTRRVQEASHAP